MKLEIKENQKFGMLTVIKELEAKRLPSGQTNRAFLCKCDCGNTKEVRLAHLSRGLIRSCGCINLTRGGDSKYRLYNIYTGMIRRCSAKAQEHSKHKYYDRKITVCEEWKSNWESFKKWALQNGYDNSLQIDRIDNNAGYEPSNCRWVTPMENANNRNKTFFVNYKGKTEPIMVLVRRLGIEKNMGTIRYRISNGWNHDEAIDTPIRVLDQTYKKMKTIRFKCPASKVDEMNLLIENKLKEWDIL